MPDWEAEKQGKALLVSLPWRSFIIYPTGCFAEEDTLLLPLACPAGTREYCIPSAPARAGTSPTCLSSPSPHPQEEAALRPQTVHAP